jgi:polar amino acid transport system substrate-binding protein
MRGNLHKLIAPLLLLGAASSSLGATENDCRIEMGWEPWPPLQFLDKNKKLTGMDVELMNAVFADMPCQLTYREGHWGRSLFEVKSGTLDALSSADATVERREWARFSEPYRNDGMAMYMRKGTAKDFPIKSLQDIASLDFRLGVLRDVNYGPEFKKIAKDPEFAKRLYYIESSIEQRYKVLKANRIDAFTYPLSAANQVDELTGGNVEVHPFMIVSSPQHVMFSRKSVSPEIVELFNASFKRVKASGVYDQILSKYKIK